MRGEEVLCAFFEANICFRYKRGLRKGGDGHQSQSLHSFRFLCLLYISSMCFFCSDFDVQSCSWQPATPQTVQFSFSLAYMLTILFIHPALGGVFINIDGDNWDNGDCGTEPPVSSNPCRSFRLVQTNISQNFAEFGGGGVYVTAPESVYGKCRLLRGEDPTRQPLNKTILNTMSAKPIDFESEAFVTDSLGCLRLDGNRVGEAGFGEIAATKAVALTVVYPEEPITNHTSNTNLAGEKGMQVGILDMFDQLVSGGNPDASELKTIGF